MRLHYYQELTTRLTTNPAPTGYNGKAIVAANDEEESRLEVAVHAVIQAIVWRVRVEVAEGLLATGKVRDSSLPT